MPEFFVSPSQIVGVLAGFQDRYDIRSRVSCAVFPWYFSEAGKFLKPEKAMLMVNHCDITEITELHFQPQFVLLNKNRCLQEKTSSDNEYSYHCKDNYCIIIKSPSSLFLIS